MDAARAKVQGAAVVAAAAGRADALANARVAITPRAARACACQSDDSHRSAKLPADLHFPRSFASMSDNKVSSSSSDAAPHASAPDDAPAKKTPSCRICCACPDTRKLRDECVVENGEEFCFDKIEAHKACLRAEGFNV